MWVPVWMGGGLWATFCSAEPWSSALSLWARSLDSQLCDLCLHGLRDSGLCLSTAGLGSDPYIHMDGSVESGLQLVCTAKGWFLEPQVSWQDIKGEKLLTFSNYNFQDEDGLFYVESTLVVRDASTEAVSCFIHNPSLAEEKGSDVSIPGQCSASRIKMLPLVGKVEGTVL